MVKSGDQGGEIKLPAGVSPAEWALEKARWQNPRIRAFLGCVRVLDEVFESNYAILHCSPKRLDQIWEQVRKIASILRSEVRPLLSKGPSKIPDLEQARESATVYLNVLDRNLLARIDSFPATLTEEHHPEVRKLLCVAIGQLHAFLLDTLGEMLARDPRSSTDADYFLTRKFARDVDESEWLHTSVARLEEYMQAFTGGSSAGLLTSIGRAMQREERVPTPEEWAEISDYLDEVAGVLVSRLKMILGLRGIRLSELELLEEHASQMPALCRTLKELHETSLVALETLRQNFAAAGSAVDGEEVVATVAKVLGERIVSLLNALYDQMRDLATYLPVWRQCIENRRALMLKHRQG